MPQCEEHFLRKLRPGVAGNGDNVHVFQPYASLIEAEPDGLYGEAGPVFNPQYALFFRGGDELAVLVNTGGGIAVIGVNAECVHL